MTKSSLCILPLLILAGAAHAEKRMVTVPGATERISTLVVYGDDPCPKSSGDEIVVCARQPESERYRIPKALRTKAYNEARDGSWAGTAKVLDFVSQQNIPGSCTPQGSFGYMGCYRRFLDENRGAAAQSAPPQ